MSIWPIAIIALVAIFLFFYLLEQCSQFLARNYNSGNPKLKRSRLPPVSKMATIIEKHVRVLYQWQQFHQGRHFNQIQMPLLQWSTEPKQDSVIFGFRFGSARFGSFRFFQENRTEYLQDKIKYKRVSRSFNRNIFLKKIQ